MGNGGEKKGQGRVKNVEEDMERILRKEEELIVRNPVMKFSKA